MPVNPLIQEVLDRFNGTAHVRPLSHPRDYRAEATQIARGGPLTPEREHLLYLLRERVALEQALQDLGDTEATVAQVRDLMAEVNTLRSRLRERLGERA